MANRKTNRTGRYQIKADPATMQEFDIACKRSKTNRSAKIDELMRQWLQQVDGAFGVAKDGDK